VDERTVFIIGAVTIAIAAVLLTTVGRGFGGRTWAIGWITWYLPGAIRFFGPATVTTTVVSNGIGSLFPVLLTYGTWRFCRGDAPVPRAWALALASLVPLRMVSAPFLTAAENRGTYAAELTICVVLCCTLLMQRESRNHLHENWPLAFAVPLIAAAGWFHALSMTRGWETWIALTVDITQGATLAIVQIGALVSHRRKAAQTLHSDFTAHYREITENSSDLFAELDETGTILYMNPAHKSVLGVDPKDVVGQPSTSVDLFLGRLEFQRASFEDDAPPDFVFVVKHQEDDRPVTLEGRLHRIQRADGKKHIVLVSRDITARAARARDRDALNERLEAIVESQTNELRDSLAKLEAANRLASLGTMAAGVAHQINNPIGSIRMSADFALATKEGDPRRRKIQEEALANAVAQSQRCSDIVSSMLQLTRKETTTKHAVDLAEIVRRVCDLTKDYGEERNCRTVTEGLDGPIPITGNSIELEQVFINVVRNAYESSDGANEVKITAERDAECAIIRIRDEGFGIPKEALDFVLEPFFTTRLESGGTGLSLSVAHGFLDGHGGSIDIQSTPGAGTTVSIQLPLRKADPAA